MSRFNAAASRAKRPCPIWVDAFQRDTQHLEADEVGAYFLILMAMWTRESCDFPADDARLARVARVSTRLWKSRVGPAVMAFFQTANGVVFSKRLREEATYVERQVKQQSDRKRAEDCDKPLEDNETAQSADISTDGSAEVSFPTTQQPTSISDTDVSDGEAVSDPTKILFDRAVSFLAKAGVPERGARSFLGKLRQDRTDDEIREAFTACRQSGAVDPIPWIVTFLGKRKSHTVTFDLSKFEESQ